MTNLFKKEIEEVKENKTERYRKKHLALHHSGGRFCSNCIEIGRKEERERCLKIIGYVYDTLLQINGNNLKCDEFKKALKQEISQ